MAVEPEAIAAAQRRLAEHMPAFGQMPKVGWPAIKPAGNGQPKSDEPILQSFYTGAEANICKLEMIVTRMETWRSRLEGVPVEASKIKEDDIGVGRMVTFSNLGELADRLHALLARFDAIASFLVTLA